MFNINNNCVALNKPVNNVFRPAVSVLPDRFNTTTLPVEYSIMGDELSSTSEPDKVKDSEAKGIIEKSVE